MQKRKRSIIHTFRQKQKQEVLRVYTGVRQIPMKTLQSIGGYTDLATLQDRYVHTQNEDIEAARAAIEDMFLPAEREES